MATRRDLRIGHYGLWLLVPIAAWLFSVQETVAAGFALKEQSSQAQGQAFAGASAGGNDPSFLFFNPASLSLNPGGLVHFGLSYIDPKADVKNATAETGAGDTITGPMSDSDIAGTNLVPVAAASWQANEQIFLGLAVNAPFGLDSEYTDGWVGRYHATKSEISSVSIDPMIGWKPLSWLHLGAGLRFQRIDSELRSAIDTSTLAGLPNDPANDSFVKFEGDDWGVGFSLGAIVAPSDKTRIGLAFRSRIDHKLKGDADFERSALGDTLNGSTQLNGDGLLADSDIHAKLTTPESLSLGIHQEITDELALGFEASWTGWSTFDELRVRFDNPDQPDSVTHYDWDDTWFLALGGSYQPHPDWTFRGGVAFDESPAPGRTRDPRIPDADRTWLSFGTSWQASDRIAINAAYTHIFFDDASIDLSSTEPGNAARGDLSADYETSVDIFSLSLTVSF